MELTSPVVDCWTRNWIPFPPCILAYRAVYRCAILSLVKATRVWSGDMEKYIHSPVGRERRGGLSCRVGRSVDLIYMNYMYVEA